MRISRTVVKVEAQVSGDLIVSFHNPSTARSGILFLRGGEVESRTKLENRVEFK